MNTVSTIRGREEAGVIVWTPAPGMLKAIVSTVGEAWPAAHSPAAAPEAVLVLAAVIASRSVQTPSLAAVSAVLLTVIVLARAEAAAKRRGATTPRESARVGFRMMIFLLPITATNRRKTSQSIVVERRIALS